MRAFVDNRICRHCLFLVTVKPEARQQHQSLFPDQLVRNEYIAIAYNQRDTVGLPQQTISLPKRKRLSEQEKDDENCSLD
jgi:hypothetical protein